MKNGQLTLKSAYILIVNRNEADPNPPVNWKDHWRISLPQRVLMFGWECPKNAIPIRTAVKSKIKSIDDKCPICEKNYDIVGHALMFYDYARAT